MARNPSEERRLELIVEALQWYAAHLEGEARRCRLLNQNRHAARVEARARECLAIIGEA